MTDYISRPEALEALSRIDVFNSVAFTPEAIAFGIGLAVAEIWGLPTAPVPEVKRGRWIHKGLYKCSVCGFLSCCGGNFCSSCGSDMREDDHDD